MLEPERSSSPLSGLELPLLPLTLNRSLTPPTSTTSP